MSILNRIVDLRGVLPQPLAVAPATGRPQPRRSQTTAVVLHYNGPAAPGRAGGNREEIAGWLRDVIIPNHIQRIRSDGVQYHLWVARDGTIYQTRDLDMTLWHCGSTVNNHSVAIHVPIGANQHPTAEQWQTTTQLLDGLINHYGLSGRSVVKGHSEVGPSECPGRVLLPMLQRWRNQQAFPLRLRVRNEIDFAAVRVAPDIQADPAMIGDAPVRLMPGYVIEASEQIGRWYRITKPDAWGFSHNSLYERVNADAPVGPPLAVAVNKWVPDGEWA